MLGSRCSRDRGWSHSDCGGRGDGNVDRGRGLGLLGAEVGQSHRLAVNCTIVSAKLG